LKTELYLAESALIDTVPYTARELPNVRCLLLADRQALVSVANVRVIVGGGQGAREFIILAINPFIAGIEVGIPSRRRMTNGAHHCRISGQQLEVSGGGESEIRQLSGTIAADALARHEVALKIQFFRANGHDHRRAAEEEWKLLQTIPGLDVVSAAMLIAETGVDMSRFGGKDRLCSWAGICPGNNESAGKRKSGRTRKAVA